MSLEYLIDAGTGREPADLVLRGGSFVNVFTNTVDKADVAIAEGREVVDLKGAVLCPGFIDAHVHIESSMLSVPEFTRTVAAAVHLAKIRGGLVDVAEFKHVGLFV